MYQGVMCLIKSRAIFLVFLETRIEVRLRWGGRLDNNGVATMDHPAKSAY
jgi:hypothetical protein